LRRTTSANGSAPLYGGPTGSAGPVVPAIALPLISVVAPGAVVVVDVDAGEVADAGGVLPPEASVVVSEDAGGTCDPPPVVSGAAEVAGGDVGRVIGRASRLLEHAASSSTAAPRPVTTCLTPTRLPVVNPTAAVSQTRGRRVARAQGS
jgi:hypothetical protein